MPLSSLANSRWRRTQWLNELTARVSFACSGPVIFARFAESKTFGLWLRSGASIQFIQIFILYMHLDRGRVEVTSFLITLYLGLMNTNSIFSNKLLLILDVSFGRVQLGSMVLVLSLKALRLDLVLPPSLVYLSFWLLWDFRLLVILDFILLP